MAEQEKTEKQKAQEAMTCRTPEFRVSFPHVFKPYKMNEEQKEAKYQLTMLFPVKTDLTPLKKACALAATKKWGIDKTKWPKPFRLPFRDGNEKADRDGYANHIFVAATSNTKPGLVNQRKDPIISEDDFYAGCYAHAQVTAFAYDRLGNKGIGFALQNIQKLKDGEAFSGRRRPEDVFDVIEDSSDDPTAYGLDENTDVLGL